MSIPSLDDCVVYGQRDKQWSGESEMGRLISEISPPTPERKVVPCVQSPRRFGTEITNTLTNGAEKATDLVFGSGFLMGADSNAFCAALKCNSKQPEKPVEEDEDVLRLKSPSPRYNTGAHKEEEIKEDINDPEPEVQEEPQVQQTEQVQVEQAEKQPAEDLELEDAENEKPRLQDNAHNTRTTFAMMIALVTFAFLLFAGSSDPKYTAHMIYSAAWRLWHLIRQICRRPGVCLQIMQWVELLQNVHFSSGGLALLTFLLFAGNSHPKFTASLLTTWSGYVLYNWANKN